MHHSITTILYSWQTLIGAALGAAVPISLWFLSQWYQSYKERRERIKILLKVVGLNMISTVEAYETIDKFLKEKLSRVIEKIDDVAPDEYFLGTAFFPLFSVHPIKIEILEINSGSGYIDNLVIEITKMSMDFELTINDSRRQFESTINGHRELCLMKAGSPSSSNLFFKNSLEQFEAVTRKEMLENNISVYVRLLAKAQAALVAFSEHGLIKWHLKFGPSFKFFKDKLSLKEFNDSAHERIEIVLKDKIDKRINDVESMYKR